MKKIVLHLVSDSTGETVSGVARASMAQFTDVEAEEFHWPLIRSKVQMQKIIDSIKINPGMVLYTIVDPTMRDYLKHECLKMRIPCVAVLGRVVKELSLFLGQETVAQVGKQHELDENYFQRMDAINFTLAHDDGQNNWNLDGADIILVGPSRTSKTPTCIYLAYRGIKAGNIPLVPGSPLPEIVNKKEGAPVFVGLTINPDTLVQIRKNRLLTLQESNETSYVDMDEVKKEVADARKIFSKYKWPVLDVTRRSVEETAAAILQIYNQQRNVKML